MMQYTIQSSCCLVEFPFFFSFLKNSKSTSFQWILFWHPWACLDCFMILTDWVGKILFSALDLVSLSIQRDTLIYQNCRLLIFVSLVAIYLLFFSPSSSCVQVQGRLCFLGTFGLSQVNFEIIWMRSAHICHQCDCSVASHRLFSLENVLVITKWHSWRKCSATYTSVKQSAPSLDFRRNNRMGTFRRHPLPNLNVHRWLLRPNEKTHYFPEQNPTRPVRLCDFVLRLDAVSQKPRPRQGGGRASGLCSRSFAVVLWRRT